MSGIRTTHLRTEGGDAFSRLRAMLDAAGVSPADIESVEVTVSHRAPSADTRGAPPGADAEAGAVEAGEPDIEPEPEAEPLEPRGAPVEPVDGALTVEAEEDTLHGVKLSNVPDMDTDSDAYRVLRALGEHDDRHYHMNEVRSFVKDSELDNANGISQRLYYLADRGLADKQPSDENKQIKKYAITSKGRAALELAERSASV